jgi:peptidoglycan LD-endopeptidase LytH
VALKATTRARVQVLLIAFVTLTLLSVFLWTRVRRTGSDRPTTTAVPVSPIISPDPVVSTPDQSPFPSPTAADIPKSEPGLSVDTNQPPQNQPPPSSFVGTVKLIIPVAGVKPDQLLDTFTDARSEGRAHDAIDIPAPAGTPVVAASDGEIVKLFQSDRGGTTIYQLSPDKKLVFYYAHLQGYADGLYVGKFVRQGEVIGYVGDTGNAGAGNYHLHFSIAALADPKRYWEGTNINPYPLLRQ